jgi:SPOR domain
MTRGWRRLVVAAVVAPTLAFACAAGSDAEAASKAQERALAARNKSNKSKKQDPVEAQHTIDAAFKQLGAGKADQAVVALSTVIARGNLPPALMAKALLYRGIAYRRQNKPAQAIADLTSALWLRGGLDEGDRKDANLQRASAFKEAGLSETGQPIASAAPARAPSPQAQSSTQTASAGSGWGAETTRQPTQQSSGWNLFENLFGGSSSSPPPPRPPAPAAVAPPPAPVAAAPVARPQPPPARREVQPQRTASSGWASSTRVQAHTRAPPVETGAIPPKAHGKYRIQVGIVRTQAEADALAAKVRHEQGALLASRAMEIDQAVVGNMGSFYRVRLGPFASQAETNAACARLKGTGLDCLVVTQ